MKGLLATTFAFGLSACTAYVSELQWVVGVKDHRDRAVVDAAVRERWTQFPGDLRECVAVHDRYQLQDIDEGREYRISGLFIDSYAVDRVIDCMRSKDWQVVRWAL